jgi:hypothetical protein
MATENNHSTPSEKELMLVAKPGKPISEMDDVEIERYADWLFERTAATATRSKGDPKRVGVHR